MFDDRWMRSFHAAGSDATAARFKESRARRRTREVETKEVDGDVLLALPGGPDNCRALQLLLLSRYFTEGTHVLAHIICESL